MPNIHGLHDNRSDDDDRDTSNDRYVGGTDGRGGGSGLAVVPNEGDAPSAGAPEDHFGSMVGRAQSNDGPQPGDENATKRKITMWKTGFQVDDGPFRSLSDDANRPFLTALARGIVPEELRPPPPPPNADGTPAAPREPVSVNIQLEDKRDQEYVPPAYTAFSGSGNSMQSESVAATSSDDPSIVDRSTFSSSFQAAPVDESQPVCSIQVRTPAGKRIVVKMNATSKVGDMVASINTNDGLPDRYQILSGFPPQPLKDFGKTIEEEGLKGGMVTVKKA